MAQKKDTLILILTLIVTGSILGAGYWLFARNFNSNPNNLSSENQNNNQPPLANDQTQPNSPSTPSFAFPETVASDTVISIDGSTSMVQINQALKQAFEQEFAGTVVNTNAKGSDNGIKKLLAGTIDIAAISRPLTDSEKNQGLVAIPITQDAIAIVVGKDNPFRRGLTKDQVVAIFQGKINNWSQLAGENKTIRVINRPVVSGTHKIFKEIVLNGSNFGNTPNFITMDRDATTPMLRMLGTDGISYATYVQVANQQTVRTVAVDGITPEAASYPYQRNLYYAYKKPATPSVEAFLGFAKSGVGQKLIKQAQSVLTNAAIVQLEKEQTIVTLQP